MKDAALCFRVFSEAFLMFGSSCPADLHLNAAWKKKTAELMIPQENARGSYCKREISFLIKCLCDHRIKIRES